jgi:ABC-type sulfate/molybdate transport systems ATPase subunit
VGVLSTAAAPYTRPGDTPDIVQWSGVRYDEGLHAFGFKISPRLATLLKQASGDWGRAILMVTHDPRIAAHADRIVFMSDGKITDDTKISGSADARNAMEKAGLL